MTEELYIKLNKCEKSLSQSMHDYLSIPTKENINIVFEAYRELFNQEPNDNHGCNTCRIRLYKRVAQEYFNYKKEQEAKALEEPIDLEIKPEEIKPKRKYNKKKTEE